MVVKSSGWTSTPMVAVISFLFVSIFFRVPAGVEFFIFFLETQASRAGPSKNKNVPLLRDLSYYSRSYFFSNSPVRWRLTKVVLPVLVGGLVLIGFEKRKRKRERGRG